MGVSKSLAKDMLCAVLDNLLVGEWLTWWAKGWTKVQLILRNAYNKKTIEKPTDF